MDCQTLRVALESFRKLAHENRRLHHVEYDIFEMLLSGLDVLLQLVRSWVKKTCERAFISATTYPSFKSYFNRAPIYKFTNR